MTTKKDRAAAWQLHSLFNVGVTRDLTDGQLLERFAAGGGEDAELAFAALVERHGAMVLRVCRARLGDPHDALDAFQATFLVLVKRARALWVRDSLGPWLHQVALRTAACAHADAARRRRLESRAAEAAGRGSAATEASPGREPGWERVLHEEIDRLPERYRIPIVLCDLQGRSCEEAALLMRRPVGTVKSWRGRGRRRLRDRLTLRGLAPAAGLTAAMAAGAATAGVPRRAAVETARAAARVVGRPTAGAVPAAVSALFKRVLKQMLWARLRSTGVLLVGLAVTAAGLGATVRVVADDVRGASAPAPSVTPDDVDQSSEPAPTDRLDLVLDAWRRESAAWVSLDVRFTGRDRSRAAERPFSGHLVLRREAQVYVSYATPGQSGDSSETHRLIWTKGTFHQFRPGTKEHLTAAIADADRRRLPAVLALPFLWNVSPEVLTERYHIRLDDSGAKTWVLSFTPRRRGGSASFSKAILQLERGTYLPRRYLVFSPDGEAIRDYRVTEVRRNQPVPETLFESPVGVDWKSIEWGWFFRLIQPDYLP